MQDQRRREGLGSLIESPRNSTTEAAVTKYDLLCSARLVYLVAKIRQVQEQWREWLVYSDSGDSGDTGENVARRLNKAFRHARLLRCGDLHIVGSRMRNIEVRPCDGMRAARCLSTVEARETHDIGLGRSVPHS